MNNVGLDTARPQPASKPKAVPAGLEGDGDASDLVPCLLRFRSPPLEQLQEFVLVRCELLNGWRSTPGMTPATSQLSLLSSITAVNVWLGSNGVSERLRSLSGFFCFCGLRIDGLHRLRLTSAPMEPSLD